jgi:nucleoside-diphosphate-sugar epimerase
MKLNCDGRGSWPLSRLPSVAVAGANGFIGNRLVERLVLQDLAIVRPLVRSFQGMSRVARFDLDCRVVDATDSAALQRELKGCTVLFYCIYGDRGTLLDSAEAAYRAAAGAGVRRLVYLSSTVVHGNAPRIGTHDDSELLADQPFEYNVSKVLAEQRLRQLRTDGAVQVVTLRPPIVFGPRSTWFSANIARDLLAGRAFLVDRGSGICNTVYVDNLVEAMWLAASSDRAVNQDFIITDGERVTWWDLYSSVAREVGADVDHVLQIDSAAVAGEAGYYRQRVFAFLSRLPPGLKRTLRMIVPSGVISGAINVLDPPLPDLYIATSQCCDYVLPIGKAREMLGYRPRFTFSEGARRTGAWLRFALGIGDTTL